jgi:hypothetical protein
VCRMCQVTDSSCDDDGSPTGCVTPAAVLVLFAVGLAEAAAVFGGWWLLF